jgi:hypothetical protein
MAALPARRAAGGAAALTTGRVGGSRPGHERLPAWRGMYTAGHTGTPGPPWRVSLGSCRWEAERRWRVVGSGQGGRNRRSRATPSSLASPSICAPYRPSGFSTLIWPGSGRQVSPWRLWRSVPARALHPRPAATTRHRASGLDCLCGQPQRPPALRIRAARHPSQRGRHGPRCLSRPRGRALGQSAEAVGAHPACL